MSPFHLFAALLLITMLALSPRADAAVSAKPIVDGLSGGTYKPLSMPALTGSNFSATGRVLINGKMVPIPGYLPPSSGAAQFAKTALFTNPLLQGALLALWPSELASGDLTFVGGSWNFSSEGTPASTVPLGDFREVYTTSSTYSQYPQYANFMESPSALCQLYPDYTCSVEGNSLFINGNQYLPIYSTQSRCGQAYYSNGSSCVLANPAYAIPDVVSRPATQEDFDALPDPSPGILRELAPQTGVPIDDPVYQPLDVDIGAPYTKPDGSTAQQRAKISPAGNGDVWIDTYEQPVTDSQGNPVENPEPSPLPDPQLTQCDRYPDTVGCARFGSVPDGSVSAESRSIDLISPVSVGGSGQCPAPMTATVAGMTIEWSFDPLCQYANSLRPLVLALAWLSAGVIFIGGVRNG